jgi:hypothetical protein
VDGIISYLTRKHGGNVHDKGIVTITSKSTWSNDPKYALRNLADLTASWYFSSDTEPNQWVCWDFQQMRIFLTHYTIRSTSLESWVLESSLDGDIWSEIHRHTDTGFWMARVGSFPISNPTECRFIRLIQAGKNHTGDDQLNIYSFEVFGTLHELPG